MATKVIVRYKPANALVGRRELTPADFESLGIFTQENVLHFDMERNYWLDADAAGISAEALQWFEDSPEFTVERQEVKGKEEDPEAARQKEAYAASIEGSHDEVLVEGAATSQSTPDSGASIPTQSTART